MKVSNILLIGIPGLENREDWEKAIFKIIMTDKFQNLNDRHIS